MLRYGLVKKKKINFYFDEFFFQGNKKFKSDTDYPDQTIITINADDDNDVVEILENENDLNNEFINQVSFLI